MASAPAKKMESAEEVSFNDSELEDIMNEIESLEKELGNDDGEVEAAPAATLEGVESPVLEADSEEDDVLASQLVAELDAVEITTPEIEIAAKVEESVAVVPEAPKAKEQESLEESFSKAFSIAESPTPPAALIVEEEKIAPKTKLQSAIDEEVSGLFVQSTTVEPKIEPKVEEPVPVTLSSAPEISEAALEMIEESVLKMEKESAIPEKKAEVHHMATKQSKTGVQNKMHFDLDANIPFDFSFNIGGESILVRIDKESGFVVEMSSGAKFTLPLKKEAA